MDFLIDSQTFFTNWNTPPNTLINNTKQKRVARSHPNKSQYRTRTMRSSAGVEDRVASNFNKLTQVYYHTHVMTSTILFLQYAQKNHFYNAFNQSLPQANFPLRHFNEAGDMLT
ncbi:MAG: hypothetical protein IIZ29_07350, partial [Schwartzia sp.]|nr:hypothetical protein [Schwartzia sp. (in: firmicutes)]